MRKKIISIILTVVLALSMITVAVVGVSADGANADSAVLSIEATSNYFPQSFAEFDKSTNELTVSYSLKSSKELLDAQWYFTYDPNVLSLSAKNTAFTVCPTITSANLNTDTAGIIKYRTNGSVLYSFNEQAPFAQIVFDVEEYDKSIDTAVNLEVEFLKVSKADKELTYISDIDEEVYLVNDNKVMDGNLTKTVTVDCQTKVVAGDVSESLPTTEFVTTELATEPTATLSTDPSSTIPETTVLSYPVLTVNSVSNYFSGSSADYNDETKEVTLTYSLKSSKDILSTQWYMTYDPEVFSLSEKNTPQTISKAIGEKSVLTTEEGIVHMNASNVNLFDFSTEKTPFVQIVFDVKDISEKAPVITTVDLTVQELVVSSRVQNGTVNDENEEIVLVKKSQLMHNEKTSSVSIDRDTSLTLGTFVEPTTAVPTTVLESTSATTSTDNSTPTDVTVDVSSAVTVPTETNAVETKAESSVDEADATSATDTNTADSTLDILTGDIDNAPIQTGNSSFAIVTLLLLIASTVVMFILRKRFVY